MYLSYGELQACTCTNLNHLDPQYIIALNSARIFQFPPSQQIHTRVDRTTLTRTLSYSTY